MCIENKTFKQLYRMIFIVLCTTGITLQYAIVSKIGKAEVLTCYYTILSNFLCLFYFAYLIVKQPEKESALIKGAVTIAITITGLVYHFMLNGAMEAGVGAVAKVTFMEVLANTLVHYVVPIMTVVDYFLFAKKGNFKWLYAFSWLLIPFAYVVFIMIRAEVSQTLFAGFSGMSRYPYPFVDVDLYGFPKVALMVSVILLAVLVLGFILYGIDFLLGKYKKKST